MNTVSRIGTSLSAYVSATAKNALITTLLFVCGFAVAGTPWWFLTGLLCGVLNLVPNFGPILSLALGLFIPFLASRGWTALLIVGGVWLAIQVLDGFVLSPRAAGKAGVNPFLSVVLVPAAGMLFGPIGMMLAVPVAVVVVIVFRALRPQ